MIWMQTQGGRKLDLMDPSKTKVDWCVIAHALARINRFTGHTREAYSVAEHCVRGHDAIEAPFKLAFLLHDAHEYAVGDLATPMANAMAQMVENLVGHGGAVKRAIKLLKALHDQEIYKAAGLPFPLDMETERAVKHMDLTMLMTERRDLLGPSPESWGHYEETPPLNEIITQPWHPTNAEVQFLDRLAMHGVEI